MRLAGQRPRLSRRQPVRDSLLAIGERFCIDYVTVGAYNDRFASTTIQPGDVLVLRP